MELGESLAAAGGTGAAPAAAAESMPVVGLPPSAGGSCSRPSVALREKLAGREEAEGLRAASNDDERCVSLAADPWPSSAASKACEWPLPPSASMSGCPPELLPRTLPAGLSTSIDDGH